MRAPFFHVSSPYGSMRTYEKEPVKTFSRKVCVNMQVLG
jgi:hypothetical protein